MSDGQLTVMVAQKVVVRCIQVAGGPDAGTVALLAALFGVFVRMEFEAEMQRRFGPGGQGGVVFSDDVTDIMIVGGAPDIWTELSKDMTVAVEPRSIAEKRAVAGILAPFPITAINGLSFDYKTWIAPRCKQLAPEFKTLSDRIAGSPIQMFPSLTLATRSMIKTVKSPSPGELATLALDVMLGVARLPVSSTLQLVPNAQPPLIRRLPETPPSPAPKPGAGWRSVFGRRA